MKKMNLGDSASPSSSDGDLLEFSFVRSKIKSGVFEGTVCRCLKVVDCSSKFVPVIHTFIVDGNIQLLRDDVELSWHDEVKDYVLYIPDFIPLFTLDHYYSFTWDSGWPNAADAFASAVKDGVHGSGRDAVFAGKPYKLFTVQDITREKIAGTFKGAYAKLCRDIQQADIDKKREEAEEFKHVLELKKACTEDIPWIEGMRGYDPRTLTFEFAEVTKDYGIGRYYPTSEIVSVTSRDAARMEELLRDVKMCPFRITFGSDCTEAIKKATNIPRYMSLAIGAAVGDKYPNSTVCYFTRGDLVDVAEGDLQYTRSANLLEFLEKGGPLDYIPATLHSAILDVFPVCIAGHQNIGGVAAVLKEHTAVNQISDWLQMVEHCDVGESDYISARLYSMSGVHLNHGSLTSGRAVDVFEKNRSINFNPLLRYGVRVSSGLFDSRLYDTGTT